MEDSKNTEQQKGRVPELRSSELLCAYCNQPILRGEPTVPDECGEPGDKMHLCCSVAQGDGDIIDNEHGDS